jgi:hypothetical protein
LYGRNDDAHNATVRGTVQSKQSLPRTSKMIDPFMNAIRRHRPEKQASLTTRLKTSSKHRKLSTLAAVAFF